MTASHSYLAVGLLTLTLTCRAASHWLIITGMLPLELLARRLCPFGSQVALSDLVGALSSGRAERYLGSRAWERLSGSFHPLIPTCDVVKVKQGLRLPNITIAGDMGDLGALGKSVEW